MFHISDVLKTQGNDRFRHCILYLPLMNAVQASIWLHLETSVLCRNSVSFLSGSTVLISCSPSCCDMDVSIVANIPTHIPAYIRWCYTHEIMSARKPRIMCAYFVTKIAIPFLYEYFLPCYWALNIRIHSDARNHEYTHLFTQTKILYSLSPPCQSVRSTLDYDWLSVRACEMHVPLARESSIPNMPWA